MKRRKLVHLKDDNNTLETHSQKESSSYNPQLFRPSTPAEMNSPTLLQRTQKLSCFLGDESVYDVEILLLSKSGGTFAIRTSNIEPSILELNVRLPLSYYDGHSGVFRSLFRVNEREWVHINRDDLQPIQGFQSFFQFIQFIQNQIEFKDKVLLTPYEPSTMTHTWTLDDFTQMAFGCALSQMIPGKTIQETRQWLMTMPLGTCIVRPSSSEIGCVVFAAHLYFRDSLGRQERSQVVECRFILSKTKGLIYKMGGARVRDLPYHGAIPIELYPYNGLEELAPKEAKNSIMISDVIDDDLFTSPAYLNVCEKPHFFNKADLKRWLATSRKDESGENCANCPMCRKPYTLKNIIQDAQCQQIKDQADEWRLLHLDENQLRENELQSPNAAQGYQSVSDFIANLNKGLHPIQLKYYAAPIEEDVHAQTFSAQPSK